jgi:hypothetical protein
MISEGGIGNDVTGSVHGLNLGTAPHLLARTKENHKQAQFE